MEREAMRAAAVLAAALAAGGCDGSPAGPVNAGIDGRIAVVAYDPGPALWVESIGRDDARRIRFTGAADDIADNHPGLPVDDGTIRALGPVKWAPAGDRLAVVAAVAYDQSEVVIIGADGTGARVASVNTQIILSDVAWSSDGTKIAYTMSTLPHATGVDVFMTDLTTHRVTRLTDGYQPGVPGVELAFDAVGRTLYVTKMTGDGTARLDRIDLATKMRTTITTSLPGEPQAISQSGSWLLLMRRQGSDRVLVRHTVATGAEVELARGPTLQFAELAARAEHAIVVSGDDRPEHRLVRLSDGASTPLAIDRRGSSAIDAWR